VIGGGDGGTVREVLRYREVEHVTLCEIDRLVIEASQQHLTEFNVPWKDPRLQILCQDGVAYLRDFKGEPFDVILVDGADPVGPAAGLFESPFYKACRARMSAQGVLASQTEAPTLMRDDFVKIVKTLRHEFPNAQPYFGPVPIYVCGLWSWTIASNTGSGVPVAREDRLAQIEAGCRYYNRDIHRAAFTLPNDLKKLL
jgi:spermidine synthase